MNHCAIAREHASNPLWQEAWRMECEARHLLSLPLQVRRDALAMSPRQPRRPALEAQMRLQHALRRRSA